MERSPYTPGAGHRPPVLAGRDDLLRAWRIGLNDVAATGRQRAPDIILTAPRGAGKTSAVAAFRDLSADQGYEVVRLQAAVGNATLVDSLLRRATARAEDGPGPWQRAVRAFERLGSINVSIAGFGAGLAMKDRQAGQPPLASPEDLAEALVALDREVRKDRPGGGVLITVDEIQSAAQSDLSLIAAALGCLNDEYPQAHVMFAATGLPNTFQAFKDAKVTHADRLFKFKPISVVLAPDDAQFAIVEAARLHRVAWEPEAAEMMVAASSGYPAHLQVLADQTWMVAPGPYVINTADAKRGLDAAADVLVQESLGPRFDSLSDREREFLTALAVGGGRTSTADLAALLARPRESISDLRDGLIAAGDIYVPRRGEVALTAPLFGSYLQANYGESRDTGNTSLLPLDELRRHADALDSNRAADGAQAKRIGR